MDLFLQATVPVRGNISGVSDDTAERAENVAGELLLALRSVCYPDVTDGAAVFENATNSSNSDTIVNTDIDTEVRSS